MTECEELANSLLDDLDTIQTMDDARRLAKKCMPGETMQVIDNVAESLYLSAKKGQ